MTFGSVGQKYYSDTLLGSLEFNFGDLVMQALKDDKVIEVLLNPDFKLWKDVLGGGMECIGELPPYASDMLMSVISDFLKTTITPHNPIVEGELPNFAPFNGARFEGLIPPVVGNPVFAIRKKASMIYPLEQYIDSGILPLNFKKGISSGEKNVLDNIVIWDDDSTASLSFFDKAIANKNNILIVGSTGSGKTTLLNAFGKSLTKVAPEDRVIVIEDTLEIQSECQNVVFLRTSDCIGIRRLVKASMRLRPDRIIIGEVRDGAALDLLKAWNTGHPGGMATIHANSAYDGLLRLEELIEEATPAPKQQLIASAVNIVVFIEKYNGSRRISEVAIVKGYNKTKGEYELEYCLNKTLAYK